MLFSGKDFFEKNGIYMHITCRDNVEDASLLVCLKIGDDTYAAKADTSDGTAGIFGGNKLYVLLDPVLEMVQVNSQQACEIRSTHGMGSSIPLKEQSGKAQATQKPKMPGRVCKCPSAECVL